MKVKALSITTPALFATCGLPRSGKSTFAKAFCEENGVTHVCPDDVRLELYGVPFLPAGEEMVWAIVKYMVKSLLRSGNSVLLDATNIRSEDRKWLDKLNCEYFVFKTLSSVCIERAKLSKQDNLIPLIERMSKVFTDPFPDRVLRYLDGTEPFPSTHISNKKPVP